MDLPTPRLDALKRHLRRAYFRLVSVLLVFGIGTSLTWYYHESIVGLLLAPAQGHLSPTGLPIITGVMDAFMFTFHLALLGGFLVAAPVAVFQIFWLIDPLLKRVTKVRRFLVIFLPLALVCYLAGVVFFYYFLLPIVLTFMLRFSAGVATPMITLDEYMDLVKVLVLWGAVVFELPLLMGLLAKFRIVSAGRFLKLQPYVPVTAVLFAMFVSYTFEFTIPVTFVALYEVGLVTAWLAGPHPPLSRVVGRWLPWLAWLAAAVLMALAVAWRG